MQAAEFRQLWGSRSELRRFQDGAITEAVLWSGSSTCQRRHVLLKIITHLLELYVHNSRKRFYFFKLIFHFFFTKCAICATTFVSSFFSHADIPKSCVRYVGGQMDDVIKVKVYLMIVNHMWMDGWMDGMFH